MLMRKTFVVLYLLLIYNGVRGETMKSKLDDLELEKQLRLLNKPAIKIIKTIYGDLYGCVDFYEQPAFDHPLLRNHHFYPEMKPTLPRTKENSRNSTTSGLSEIWLNAEGCPLGTVPIKRITKDDLMRQKHMPPPEDVTFDAQTIANNNSISKSKYRSLQGGYKVAIARTRDDPNNKFGGAAMATSIWNPHVEGQQHSASRLKIQKGSDILQAGWRVDPTLYGDTKTRRFIHFQAGNTNCFNILCPGFILVNKDIPIDMALKNISQIGAKIAWVQTLSIDRDLVNGNWWLLLERNYIQIGFWPQRIFTSLKSFATNVEWGGVVYSPPGVPAPPMGCGRFPSLDTSRSAYCRRITVLNDKGDTIEIENTITHVDNSKLYDVWDYPRFIPGKYQHWVLYGGPGENKRV